MQQPLKYQKLLFLYFTQSERAGENWCHQQGLILNMTKNFSPFRKQKPNSLYTSCFIIFRDKTMADLPIAAVARIAKNNGAERVGSDASDSGSKSRRLHWRTRKRGSQICKPCRSEDPQRRRYWDGSRKIRLIFFLFVLRHRKTLNSFSKKSTRKVLSGAL